MDCGGFKSKIYSILDQSKLNNLLKDLGYDEHVGSPEAGTGAAARMEAAATEDENSPGEGAEEAGTEQRPAGAVTAGQASRTPQEETDNNNAGERFREKTKRKIILKKVGHSVVKRPKSTKRMTSVDQTKIEPLDLDSVAKTGDDKVKKKTVVGGKLKKSKCKHCAKMITSCNMSKHVKRFHSNELQHSSNEAEASRGGESGSGEFNCCFCHKTLKDR